MTQTPTPDGSTVLLEVSFKRETPYHCMIPNCGGKYKTLGEAVEHLKGHAYA